MADHQPKLTKKQEDFVAAYLGEAKGNATEAARMANYTHPEASAKDNLRNPTIIARVSQHVEEKFATADAVLRELTDVAMAEWRDFVEVLAWSRDGEPLKVKMDLSNKVKALELLGKYHQLFIERQQLDVNIREHRVGVPQSALDRLFQPAEELHA